MTNTEAVLWEHLRKGSLRGFHFRRQQIIDGFIVDFYCHAAGVVVEIDGLVHADQADYDAERDRILSARGLKIMRFTNQEIENELYRVIGEIGKACRLRQHHIS